MTPSLVKTSLEIERLNGPSTIFSLLGNLKGNKNQHVTQMQHYLVFTSTLSLPNLPEKILLDRSLLLLVWSAQAPEKEKITEQSRTADRAI